MDLKDFKCLKCGECCRPSGWVVLTPEDADALARHLKMDVRDFLNTHTFIMSDRRSISLNEKEDGRCIFLSDDNSCAAQDAKPSQCRRFPFEWNYPGWERICAGARALLSAPSESGA